MLEERKKKRALFDACVKKTDGAQRIPLFSNNNTYSVSLTNYKLSEVYNSFDKIAEVDKSFYPRFHYDSCLGVSFTGNTKIQNAMGLKGYHIDDENHSLQYQEQNPMQLEDLDIINSIGWFEYLKQYYIPQRFKADSLDELVERFSKGNALLGEFGAASAAAIKTMADCNVLNSGANAVVAPPEFFLMRFMGFKRLSTALRRKEEELNEAMKSLWTLTSVFNAPINEDNECLSAFDFYIPPMAHSIMNPKQFEKFYWPYIKEAIDYAQPNNKTAILYCEAQILRFKDFLQDIPRGVCALLPEMEDIFEMKKELGDNICIMGGFPLYLLGNGTKAECLDFAKKLVDEVAYDKSYIYAENKMLLFPKDAKVENLEAVTDFFTNFRY